MAIDLTGRLDALAGAGIERAVVGHHRRRLRRLGQSGALHPPDDGLLFAAGEPPPRHGCRAEVLIDGAQALPRLAEDLARARSHVHLTGWHLEAAFELVRGERPVVLGALLAELAQRIDVRILVWAGAPVPLFHPTRAEVSAGIEELVRDTRIRCEKDPREHPVHCHHEKTVVIDDEIAYVGGIDLTTYGGDRFDTPAHPARRRLGWHDVATRLQGPVVADVAGHFAMRWHMVTGETLPPPAVRPGAGTADAGAGTVQLVRTVDEDMYPALPRGDFRILEAYIRGLRSAQRLVYLENQFLWAPEIVSILAGKLRRPPAPEFRVVVLLPAHANNGHGDTRGQVSVLIDADADGGGPQRFLAATIRSRTGDRADPAYVHAKVGIVDDRWLTIGSANLNAHSLLNDTECNIVTDDAALARETRERLWAEHLELGLDEVRALGPGRLVDEHWMPIAREQLRRRRAQRPPSHRLLELPGVSRRSMRLLGPLQELVDDG